MSDDQRVPDPSASEGVTSDPFAEMNVTPIDLTFPQDAPDVTIGDFTAPNPNASKPGFWARTLKRSKHEEKVNRPPKVRRPIPSMSNSKLQKALTDFYSGIGVMLMPIYPDIAMQIAQNAERCADAWVELANTNPNVKRFLVGLVTTSTTGVLIMAHVPIFIAVAVQVMPGLKERQEKAFNDIVSNFGATIPTEENGGER